MGYFSFICKSCLDRHIDEVCLHQVYWLNPAKFGIVYREMEVTGGHVKFQNQYGRVNVQVSGNCKMWRSGLVMEDGGWLSTDVYVDISEQKWHANLKVSNFFVPVKYLCVILSMCFGKL